MQRDCSDSAERLGGAAYRDYATPEETQAEREAAEKEKRDFIYSRHWMAENDERAFLVATANDIETLPPELLRKGRMDEIFFVDLPDLETRRRILEIHLEKRDLRTRDVDVAADAMQEAFIRAFDALDTCNRPDRFGSWFFRILTNQCHNHRDRTRPHVSLDGVAVAGADDPERDLTGAEIRAAVDRALDGLSPDLRETFVLREIEGRPYSEIADLLETGEPALRKRVERARGLVRSALEELL